ncbi:unnamed protein product, partial [Toxocara canis]|uniref:Frigida-LIKE protein n=2 Tax=Toxocara canis TaxID=6265 RepID=A0A183U0E5_TOXCA
DRFDYGSNISAVEYGSNVRPKHSFTSSTADHDSLSLATYRNMDYSVYASTMPTKRRSGK